MIVGLSATDAAWNRFANAMSGGWQAVFGNWRECTIQKPPRQVSAVMRAAGRMQKTVALGRLHVHRFTPFTFLPLLVQQRKLLILIFYPDSNIPFHDHHRREKSHLVHSFCIDTKYYH